MSLDNPRLAILGDAGHPDVNRWCAGLQAAGADVHLISINAQNAVFEPSYIIKRSGIPYKLHYIVCAPQVRQLLKMIQPDVLICYDITGYGALGTLTRFHPIVPMIVGSDILIQPEQPLMRWIVRQVLGRADIVTTLAPHMATAAYHHNAIPENTHVIPLGIDLSAFNPRQYSVSDQIQIVSTRSLKSIYNIDKMIEAVDLLRQRDFDCKLTIVGHGPLKDELVQLVANLGISDRVEFTGFIPNANLPDLLRQHQYYVTLSPSDGVSSSLLEAMAIGLFPIVPNIPANQHWVTTGENGVLLDAITPQALADALAAAHADSKFQKHVYDQNLKIVQDRGSLPINSQRYVDLFRSLIL